MIALYIVVGVALYVVAGVGWLLCDFEATDAHLANGTPLLWQVAIWPVLAAGALWFAIGQAWRKVRR